jgi:predicted HicB family RNase H-like nuclease
MKKPSVAELVAGFDEEVARVEAKFGPQVQGRMVGPGRPRKGMTLEPTGTHSLRVPDAVWDAMKAKAAAAGVSLNQAANLAMLEWTRH